MTLATIAFRQPRPFQFEMGGQNVGHGHLHQRCIQTIQPVIHILQYGCKDIQTCPDTE